jgi:ribosomal-protein-alanine acetyltransferase
MDFTTETATINNLDDFYEIEKLSFGREAFTRKQIAYLLTDYNAIAIAARANNRIAGFTIARLAIGRNKSFGHIITVDVLPSYRRKGIAQGLLRKVESTLREKGACECLLEVREDNVAAIKLYKKLGYDKVGRLEKYYGEAHGLYFKKDL